MNMKKSTLKLVSCAAMLVICVVGAIVVFHHLLIALAPMILIFVAFVGGCVVGLCGILEVIVLDDCE
jgi:hypothetical protein